jgi:spore maturation protein CgeB
MKIDFFGLSITSSWGNGHATTYRALLRALAARGHELRFFERDVPWYADNRDLPDPPFAETRLYQSVGELDDSELRRADLVVVGSYVPEAVRFVLGHARGVTAFYDIDTPVTFRQLCTGEGEYLRADEVPRFDLYLSFTGGPILDRLGREFGARRPRPLYCAFDPGRHHPMDVDECWDLGYLGTYSADRQPALERLLLGVARRWPEGRFAVGGPQYPDHIEWPDNCDRMTHVAPPEHPAFYGAQRFTLNLTRADMIASGWSPSVRLFEAAACGVPIISDSWPGLERFFVPGQEILVARSPEDVLRALREVPDSQRRELAARARRRVLSEHTAAHRAETLERYVKEIVEEARWAGSL